MSRLRPIFAAVFSLLLSGCYILPTAPQDTAVATPDDVASCISQLGDNSITAWQELDAGNIRIVNWNIQKGRHPAWVKDLAGIQSTPDLLIIQEASPRYPGWRTFVPRHFHAFSEGFGWRQATTGVMTLSAVPPMTKCNLVSHEPWLGTRKATLVTQYALTDTDLSLLVVNIHGVNFTWGIRALERQLDKARKIIAAHNGPVLFAGDFNTWRGKKARVLEEVVSTVELMSLSYNSDHRKRVFGQLLDHIYVRGLNPLQATTRELESSDHNPMMVRLSLIDQPKPAVTTHAK